ncbi:MAG: peroxiredoxin [Methylacidiphilales bacterium]|nr:peroxiredoxin [Candidatus Methylacidiphilales bacterium]
MAVKKKIATKKKILAKKKIVTKKKATSKNKVVAKKKTVTKKKIATKKKTLSTVSQQPSNPIPSIGNPAPDFEFIHQGRSENIGDFAGIIVLYFYPKDDTPGCTIEANGFNKIVSQLADRQAIVVGVSPDSAVSHAKFKDKYSLSFYLVPDTDQTVSKKYGCWVEKSMYGKSYMGVSRTTFIIKNGIITHVFTKVSPNEHAEEVLSAVNSL